MKTIMAAAALAAATALAAGCSAASAPQQQAAPAAIPAPAPFKITPVHCGSYSPAQQDRFSDYGGLIFTYRNTGSSPAAVLVRVNFVQGSTVLGSNVTAYEPVIKPGQTGTAEVGYPAAKVPVHFTCQVTQVAAQ